MCWSCHMHRHTLHCRGSSFSVHEHCSSHRWYTLRLTSTFSGYMDRICVHVFTSAHPHMEAQAHTNTQTYTASTLCVCHDSGTTVLKNPASPTKTPTGQQLFLLDPSWGRKRKKRKRASRHNVILGCARHWVQRDHGDVELCARRFSWHFAWHSESLSWWRSTSHWK